MQTIQELPTSEHFELHQVAEGVYAAIAIEDGAVFSSAGFVKKPWEVILSQPLEAQVVESVLTGDLWCKIAIHLPDGI